MSEPIAIITNLGRDETISAENAGLSISMSRIAIGAAIWSEPPTASVIAMKSQLPEYFPIADATKTTGQRLHVTAKIDGDAEYSFYEFALMARTKGTEEDFLFAIAASTDREKPLGVKRKGATLLLAFDLTLVGFKDETITVNSEAPRLTLSLAEEFAKYGDSFITHAAIIKNLMEEVARLQARVTQLEMKT